jgi:hypothetical protein
VLVLGFTLWSGTSEYLLFSDLNTNQSLAKGAETVGQSDVPSTYVMFQNYPNPFNPSTIIRYGLPEKSAISLDVFNSLGQKVATLIDGEEEAGYHEVSFDGSGLASGVYVYRLTAGSYMESKRFVMLR